MKRIILISSLPILIMAAGLFMVFSTLTNPSPSQSFPEPRGFVNDFAGVMSPEDAQAVEALATAIQEKTGAELALVTIKTVEPYADIDHYSLALAGKWGIGKKDKDNGVLLILAVDEREVKIEVGYGLEGALPDSAAGRILDTLVIPAFRAGNFSGGLAAGAQAIAGIITKENGLIPSELNLGTETAVRPEEKEKVSIDPFFFVIVPILLVLLRIFLARRFPGSSSGRHGFGSGSFGSSSSGSSFGGFGGGGFGGGGASRGF
jgi:uncharacterized protein